MRGGGDHGSSFRRGSKWGPGEEGHEEFGGLVCFGMMGF